MMKMKRENKKKKDATPGAAMMTARQVHLQTPAMMETTPKSLLVEEGEVEAVAAAAVEEAPVAQQQTQTRTLAKMPAAGRLRTSSSPSSQKLLLASGLSKAQCAAPSGRRRLRLTGHGSISSASKLRPQRSKKKKP